MRDISTKSTGDTLTADEWNDVPSEIENAITSTGIALATLPTPPDLFQLGKSIANYSSVGDFFNASGLNSYTLASVSLRQAPTGYSNGMRIRFIVPATNTGAATVDVVGLGVKPLNTRNALDPTVSGDLQIGELVTAQFITSADAFDLVQDHAASDTRKGKSERATSAEVLAGLDDERFVTSKTLNDLLSSGGSFESGTKMPFFQAAAPTGWTLDVTQNDKVLRVVNTVGGTSGGTWFISGISVHGHTLGITEIPAHSHTMTNSSSSNLVGGGPGVATAVRAGQTPNPNTGFTGGSGPHSHGSSQDGSWRPSYIDVIICTKN